MYSVPLGNGVHSNAFLSISHVCVYLSCKDNVTGNGIRPRIKVTPTSKIVHDVTGTEANQKGVFDLLRWEAQGAVKDINN